MLFFKLNKIEVYAFRCVQKNGEDYFVNITVYDLQGKEVQTIVNDEKTTGRYSVNFNAQNISSGIFFTRMSVNGKSQKIIKMILIK
jgi:hypothetical protein